MVIDGFTLIDAIYQTGITFTTVGFGEQGEISKAGRFFTITLIITGFAVFTLSIGIIVNEINKGKLFETLKEHRMVYHIARLKNHFVLFHHNDYTIEVSKQLLQNHIPFVVVDKRDDMDEIAEKYKYPYYINDDPHSDFAMRKAHLSSAKGVVALSNQIADNIAIVASVRLLEREYTRGLPFYVISRAENEADSKKLLKLGADNIVSPAKLTGQRISAMAIRPDMENLLEEFLNKKDTPLGLEEIFVPKTSWMVLQKLRATHIRDVTNVSIVGIRKKDGTFIPMPKGEMLVTSESKLLVIGRSIDIKKTKQLIYKREKPEVLKFA
jgi:voltage-gated potassium channel